MTDKKKFKVNGYLLVMETGEYSDYEETWFIFNKMPDLNAIWERIKIAPKAELGEELVASILEEYGGQTVPRVATIKANWKFVDFHNNITGETQIRNEKYW